MRVAVISDIHGNAFALEAVLADIDQQAPDAILNLGDHFYGPLDSRPNSVHSRITRDAGHHGQYRSLLLRL
jgi:predicted phosphodiesterase